MKRKRRKGEVVCRCGAYHFPHRMLGGACWAAHIPADTWEKNQGGGVCRDCMLFDKIEHACQVQTGQEPVTMCPEWQEFMRFEEVQTYGKDKPTRIISSRLVP
jgi:hypothetical protein